jgi:thymidine kinase
MSLELYIGPMFSGKSTTVMGILRRNRIIQRKTLCITSNLDNRYSLEPKVMSHDSEWHPAMAGTNLTPFLTNRQFMEADCIIVEEAQFFPDLKAFVLYAVETYYKHVICVGLDGDSHRQPFGQLLELIPYCDSVRKLTALCSRCGDGTAAIFTHRLPGAPIQQVAVGGTEHYEPLCRRHFLAHSEKLSV